MPKKVLIALPPAMLEQVDNIATYEHRTRSDLIREALRRYLDAFKRTQTSVAQMFAPPNNDTATKQDWITTACGGTGVDNGPVVTRTIPPTEAWAPGAAI